MFENFDLTQNLQMLMVQLIPFMMAVVFHEVAHGWAALHWGDSTAKDAGRLTFNPVPHVDPIGTLLIPIFVMVTGMNILFGWAKPVPISPSRFRKYRPGLFWVSFAGPGMNFTLAFVSAFVFCGIIAFVPHDFYLFEPLKKMAEISILLNWALGIFNLLPIPPLDGSKIIESFLSYEQTQKYEKLAQYSFFIIMALIFTGAIRILFYPISFLANLTLTIASSVFSLFGVF